MKLELDQKEVHEILLTWAEATFPGQFNHIDLDTGYTGYHSLRAAVFTKTETEAA